MHGDSVPPSDCPLAFPRCSCVSAHAHGAHMLQLLRHLGRLLGEALAQGRCRCSSCTLLQKPPLKCKEVAQLHAQSGAACGWHAREYIFSAAEEYGISHLRIFALSGGLSYQLCWRNSSGIRRAPPFRTSTAWQGSRALE